MPSPRKSARRPSGRRIALLLALGVLLVLAWSAILLFQPEPRQIKISKGEASPQDILAPRKITYLSRVLTEEARRKAEESVEKAYTAADPNLGREQVARAKDILAYIEAIRHDRYSPPQEKIEALRAIPDLPLSTEIINLILSLDESEWAKVSTETLRVLSVTMRDDIRETDLGKARRRVPGLISHTLSDKQHMIVTALVQGLIKPNSFYDHEQTLQARQAAREAIEPIQHTIEKGEAIVREGDIVTDLDIEELAALGLLETHYDWRNIVSIIVFVLMSVTVLISYLYFLQPDFWKHPRRLLFLTALLIGAVGANRLLVPGHAILSYLLPTAGVSMLLALFLDTHLAIFATAILSGIVCFAPGGTVELATYSLLGGLIGALGVSHLEQLSTFVRTGFYTALVNVGVVLTFRLSNHDYDAIALLQLTAVGIASAILSTSLSFASFSLLGRLFGLTTPLQLMELSRPTHPLFRQLLLKAPGTHHHSLIIGNMAEAAASAIGADSLMARVGAYYHDIGKTLRPYFFAENQSDGENVHDRLDPVTSAQIIISHVTDGLVLAKKYGLPEKIRAFIPEHHGTTLVSYFYRRAQDNNLSEEIEENNFRYPGPKPQSKETAIVMLADSIEARVRADRPSTPAEMARLVREVINDRLVEGQLDECDLTLRDLEKIREAFLTVLQGIFHPRVQYPEPKTASVTTTEEDS